MTGAVQKLEQAPARPPASRAAKTGKAAVWTVGAVAGIAAVWAGAADGIWFVPFIAGVVTGVVGTLAVRGGGAAVAVAALIALGGWGLPLAWAAAHGSPVSGTARTVAALAGLPAAPATVVVATLLVAVLQAIAGAALGRAVVRLVTIRSG